VFSPNSSHADSSENGWLKTTARGVVSNFRAKHSRRLKRIQDGLAEDHDALTDALPNGYAVSREDRLEIGQDVGPEESVDG
jgi:hypothetical protein